MDEDKNPTPETRNNSKKTILVWATGGCAALVIIVVLAYVLTTPPTPAGTAEQYIEDHYDAVAESVTHTAFPDSPFKAEILAEVAESIAEQVIPYNCRETASTENTVETRCNLSFSPDKPLELQVNAPFRVSLNTANRDVFGRTNPAVQDSEPIISEMTVNGLNLERFREAQAKIKDVKETISEASTEVDEAKETISQAGSEIKDLLGK